MNPKALSALGTVFLCASMGCGQTRHGDNADSGGGTSGQDSGTTGTGGTGGTGGRGGSGGQTVPQTFSVSGTVSGLTGSGLMLSDGAGHARAISADGAFTFPTLLASGTAVNVTVTQQPSTPTQVCTVAGGTVAALTTNLTGVAVTCTTRSFTIGGAVTGLHGTGLVLRNSGGDDLTVNADGNFTFATAVASGQTFTVSIRTQPSGPTQTCQLSGGSGTVGGANVTSVAVNCDTNRYMVGGTVSGLTGTGLVLQNNNGDDLALSANGTFAFATTVSSGAAFAVTVKTHPTSPTETCSVSAGSGTVASGNVTTVAVACSTNAYAVGGIVTGLAGTGLVLQNNLGDNLSVTTAGGFTFATPVASGGAYAITILTQPSSPTQTCVVSTGTGTVSTSPITNVSITCTTSTYTIGGTVVGLNGSGLVLLDNGGNDLNIAGNGTFVFTTPISSGATFAVTIGTQPSSPSQTCGVSGGTGTVGSANVTSVTVNCSTDHHVVGGIVTNLAGSGLELSLNGGSALSVSGNGSFAFPTTLASGATYTVTIASQPTALWQTCSVDRGTGTIASLDIINVGVNCVTNTYTVGGTVTGLAGTGLLLQNNVGDDLTIAANGAFTFATAVASGQGYAVTVAVNPSGPTQTCTVASASGGIAGASITDVAVTCTTNAYAVGGSISGLAGTVVLRNNASDPLTLNANGTFVFPIFVASGDAYAVTVLTQPSGPTQTCTVTAGSGTVVASTITTVTVTCVTNKYSIGGTVTGLAGSGLVLQNNGGDDLTVAPGGGGTFTFATTIDSGSTYAVTVETQPSVPTQTCVVMGGTGTVGGSNVTSVTVNCATNTYTVGGTVTGLVGTGLVLQNNGGDDLAISGVGSFAFATPVASGGAYAVTVQTQPTTPWQTCTVTSGTGTVVSANVTTVQVTCTTNTYNVAVAVTGLAGTGLVIQNNAGDNLSVTGNATFTFATKVASGGAYNVTVLTQPAALSQTCTVTAPTGTVAGADVTLALACTTNTYTVGGTVSGLAGSGLVLQNNLGNNRSIAASGAFTFTTSVPSGGAYAVTVLTQPTSLSQTCVVTSGSGTVTSANITNVAVTCTTNTYNVSVAVTGLAGTGLVVQNNGGNNLSVTGNATFTFTTKVASGAGYNVTVLTQPATLSQTCTVTSPTGTIVAADVTLAVTCVTNRYSVGGTISGLTAAGLVLRDNGGDDLTVASGATAFTFATMVASGGAYAVTVQAQPTGLICTVTSGSGTVTSANVTSVSISCAAPTMVCGMPPEGGTLTLACPGIQRISAIVFASYGTPNGSCGAFTIGTCHAANSTTIVSAACLNQTSCTVGANNGVFGDPCGGTFKRLYAQVTCQ